MSLRTLVAERAAARRRLVTNTTTAADDMWRQVQPDRLDVSWRRMLPQLLLVVAGAQMSAARGADTYLDEVVSEQGGSTQAAGRVNGRLLAGIASDGRPLESLLAQPVVATLAALNRGVPMQRALAGGQANLDMIVSTQVADAGRVADEVAMAARPAVTGWVRMISPSACSRCAILAGRVYEWNAGFLRHPSCGCTHAPAVEDTAGDLRTDPQAYFDSLSQAEQDRIFTQAGAEAIRLGADPGQVVNARRGMRIAQVYSRDVAITLEGTTRRGFAGQRLIAEGSRVQAELAERATRISRDGPVQRQVRRQRVQIPRLMPDQILAETSSRDDAVRLLQRFGFIR